MNNFGNILMKFGNEFWLILIREYIIPKLFAVWGQFGKCHPGWGRENRSPFFTVYYLSPCGVLSDDAGCQRGELRWEFCCVCATVEQVYSVFIHSSLIVILR